VNENLRLNQKLLDEQANKFFNVFKEAIFAFNQGELFSLADNRVMENIERLIPDIVDKNSFRRSLAAFYRSKERQGTLRWDSDNQIRDALLQRMNVSLNDYLVTMGLKRHRSIDDPWEKEQ